ANNLREGGILGGYMTITAKGGSVTTSGRMCGAPLGEIGGEELQRVYYYSIFPSAFLTIQPDFVMATRLSPVSVARTRVVCDFLFAPESLASPDFDPEDGIEIWDVTNRQDWRMCELAQQGLSSPPYMPRLSSRAPHLPPPSL